MVAFDDFNVLVSHNEAKAYIELLVGVPLADGEMAKIKVTLRAPVKVIQEDGKPDYKMNFDTNFSVIHAEKHPTGTIQLEERDGLSWEIPSWISRHADCAP